jgi:tartrate/fumarate subfamily iron-sulfur-dependent hydro-lyase beta chain
MQKEWWNMRELTLPISEADIRALHAGEIVSLSGVVVTARDMAHKYLVEHFIHREPASDERALYEEIRALLRNGGIYHCGPVMKRHGETWQMVAGGPTTSSREEEYADSIIEHFGVRVIIGKGGMGGRTKSACLKHGAIYLHAVGGAAALIAQSVKEVTGVWKLEFGMPEAMWQLRISGLRLVVTIDAHGRNWHEEIANASEQVLQSLLAELGG